jgi:AcrR family transcriptional regulator
MTKSQSSGNGEIASSGRTRPSERRSAGAPRRRTALSLDAIIARALAILDAEGIGALTLRRLAADLGAGVASMYWHVDNKDELLSLCYEATMEPLSRELREHRLDPAAWRAELRELLSGLFELMQSHPWVPQLMIGPLGQDAVVLRIWDQIGSVLTAAGLDEETVFYATSALATQVGAMGLAAARNAYGTDGRENREERLERRADELSRVDPAEYPYVAQGVIQFRDHSETDQFLGGIDLILDGVAARLHPEIS